MYPHPGAHLAYTSYTRVHFHSHAHSTINSPPIVLLFCFTTIGVCPTKCQACSRKPDWALCVGVGTCWGIPNSEVSCIENVTSQLEPHRHTDGCKQDLWCMDCLTTASSHSNFAFVVNMVLYVVLYTFRTEGIM